MVDFKRALKAQKLKLECDGYVNEIEPCDNEAIYHTKGFCDENKQERNHVLCEECYLSLFPRVSEQEREDSKYSMLGYKYRLLGEAPRKA